MVLWVDKGGSGPLCLGAGTGMKMTFIEDLHKNQNMDLKITFSEPSPYIVMHVYFCCENQKGLK